MPFLKKSLKRSEDGTQNAQKDLAILSIYTTMSPWKWVESIRLKD